MREIRDGGNGRIPSQFQNCPPSRLDEPRPNCYSAPIMLTKPVYFYFYFFSSSTRRNCCEAVVSR